jgi:putative nucleotidyltransferase with HDIG domain
MMSEQALLDLKQWFEEYTTRLTSADADIARNIKLKQEHTRYVALEILDIANSLSLQPAQCYLAETVALLHDIGRFEQYRRYRTFDDRRSCDHAERGVEILAREEVLESLAPETRSLICTVVANHNRAEIPEDSDERSAFFLRLLRDADKIDIWRVVTEHYRQQTRSRNRAIDLGLSDSPAISERIVEKLLAGTLAQSRDMKTQNDLKLLQMGWVFDLNFSRSFFLVKSRRYLEKILATLPRTGVVEQIYSKAKAYLHSRSPCRRCDILGGI